MMPIRQPNLLEVNEFLVLDYIRDRGQTTRGEVERDLGMSRATVSRMVRRLVAGGSVEEARGISSRGGRPSDVLKYNFLTASVIAADVGLRNVHVALADMGGTIVADFVRPTLATGSAYETLRALIGEASSEARGKGLPVSSLVVGLPAIIDPDTGAVFGSPWDFGGPSLVQRLERDVNAPIAVENEANLAAIAQAWRGLGRGVRNFAVLSIGSGVGGAVVANGQLVRGFRNAAGEVGFLVPSISDLRHPANASAPLLERALGAAGITSGARAYLAEIGLDGSVRPDQLDPPAIFRAAEANSTWATHTVEHMMDLVALAVITVSAVLDPQLVILDGGIGRALGPYVDGIVQRVHLRVPVTPSVRVSELGPNSTIIGAVAAGLEFARKQRAPRVAHRPVALWTIERNER